MSALHHDLDHHRISMDFEDGQVWVDYARQGDTLSLLHVEADHALRGTGAAGAFMQALTERAREESWKLHPVCSYAVVWLRRHKEAADLLA
jgi:predicted GNAT family acetyltransferase